MVSDFKQTEQCAIVAPYEICLVKEERKYVVSCRVQTTQHSVLSFCFIII